MQSFRFFGIFLDFRNGGLNMSIFYVKMSSRSKVQFFYMAQTSLWTIQAKKAKFQQQKIWRFFDPTHRPAPTPLWSFVEEKSGNL